MISLLVQLVAINWGLLKRYTVLEIVSQILKSHFTATNTTTTSSF